MENREIKGKPTFMLKSIYETAKTIRQNSNDFKVIALANEQIELISSELIRRNEKFQK